MEVITLSEKINKGMNEHCEQVVDLLFNKGPCTLEDIMERLQKKKRTAQNVVSVLTKTGVIMKDNSTNAYTLTDKNNVINPKCDHLDGYELSSNNTVDEWIILFMLSYETIHKINIENIVKIYKKYFEDSYPLSNDKIRKIINRLIEKGYLIKQSVEHNRFEISISESAPLLTYLDDTDVFETFPNYYLNFKHAKDEGEILKEIAHKLNLVIPDYSVETFSGYIASGRFNNINEIIKNKLNDYLKLNFKKKVIDIEYFDSAGNRLNTSLHTGLLVYSVEKNAFYVFGINKNKERTIIRLDSITNTKETDKNSTIEYHNKEFIDIFNRMYSISVEESKLIEFLFQDKPYVRKKIEALCEIRGDNALIEESKAIKGWFIYKDNISGLNDFLPYIRSFGSSAVVIKPIEILNSSIKNTEKLINHYEVIINEKI